MYLKPYSSKNRILFLSFLIYLSACDSPKPSTQSKAFKSQKAIEPAKVWEIGDTVDIYHGVAIIYGGEDFTADHGYNYSPDGYLIGQRWQCVEFVKRYYLERFQHKMPNVYGHAIHFFNDELTHGALNPDRNLRQFYNGKEDKPQSEDLIVFDRRSAYGHVAIVGRVTQDSLEIVQQNIVNKPREWLPLTFQEGIYTVGKENDRPIGWLRR